MVRFATLLIEDKNVDYPITFTSTTFCFIFFFSFSNPTGALPAWKIPTPQGQRQQGMIKRRDHRLGGALLGAYPCMPAGFIRDPASQLHPLYSSINLEFAKIYALI